MGKNFVLRPENTRQPRSFGSSVTFGKRRDKGTGYMARSERAGPGVIVLHEFFGLTPSFRDLADRLCDEGFTALAVDLYDGATAGSVDEALALMDSLDEEQVILQLKAATDHLASNWHPRVGVVGFSLGAGLALGLIQEARLDAAVVYYGCAPVDGVRVTCPVLGHFAEEDDWEPLDEVTQLFEELQAAGADAEMTVYPGTGHWFANADIPSAFDPEAAEAAWHSTVAFLRHHLA